MRVPGWVVVLTMMINAALLMVLKSLPQASTAYYIIPPTLAALGVFLGLVKSPIGVSVDGQSVTETTLTTTTTTPPPPPSKAAGFVNTRVLMFIAGAAVLSLFALAYAGCASGADGLRQACSTTDRVLEGAYQATRSGYKVDQEHLRAQLAANVITGQKADETMVKHKNIVDKVLATLDGLKASKQAFCALIPAVEAGQRKDTPQIIASVTQIGAAIPVLVASIQQLMSVAEKPPEPERLVFIDRRRCVYV